MEKGWKNILNSSDEYLVTMARDLLQDEGIESVVINHKDSSYIIFGEYELYVRELDEQKAAIILEQINKGRN